ncbi:MAG: HAD family hydrolase [Patescibacteria group bacterium]
MKYKVILFDGDGVTLKSGMLFSEKLDLHYGIKHEVLQPFFTGVFLECTIGKADLKEELSKVLGDWGWRGGVDELLHFWFTEGTQMNEEVVEFIKSLSRADARFYLATDQEKYRLAAVQKIFEPFHLFKRTFCGAELGIRKKDPRFFELVYSELLATQPDLQKNEVLLVDDGQKNIDAAKTFGFDAHFYSNLEDLKHFLN